MTVTELITFFEQLSSPDLGHETRSGKRALCKPSSTSDENSDTSPSSLLSLCDDADCVRVLIPDVKCEVQYEAQALSCHETASTTKTIENGSVAVQAGLTCGVAHVKESRPCKYSRKTKKNTLFLERDPFWNFPYPGAGKFRGMLLHKRATQDTAFLLEEVSARLGPSEQFDDNDWSLPDTGEIEITRSSNPFSVLEDLDNSCFRSGALLGKARQLVRWFEGFGFKAVSALPETVVCGQLRSSVRGCFGDVSPQWELSFKTVAKIERSCCKACLPQFEQKLEAWKLARSVPQTSDERKLTLFRQALAMNVPKGWDSFRSPWIPNGNATLSHTRRDGGNWRTEPFSSDTRIELVFSSGKPRVVTLYSEFNTRVLAPLHYSLYSVLKKTGWLLVGEPTDRHIKKLNGAQLLSFDYSSATDNIKTDYVRCAVDVLKERAESLSEDELRCLDTFSNLSVDGVACGSGQPMGSVLSFPLLCLINKTVVDMALIRMLEAKEISFREFSSHQLLVNGDDLLTREVRKTTNLRGRIADEGRDVGLIVNDEKTMSSDTDCEINSTYFSGGKKQTKFNASAVWMDPGVEDVLGYAAQSSPDVKTFRKLVRYNANILAKSSDKHLDQLPAHLHSVCRKDAKIRRAITSLPQEFRKVSAPVIRMSERPEDYSLCRSDEVTAMENEVERCRERGVAWASDRAARKKFRTRAVADAQTYSRALKRRTKSCQELIPSCYVNAFLQKQREVLREEYVAVSSPFDLLPPGDGSTVSVLLDNLRLFKRNKAVPSPGTLDTSVDFVGLN